MHLPFKLEDQLTLFIQGVNLLIVSSEMSAVNLAIQTLKIMAIQDQNHAFSWCQTKTTPAVVIRRLQQNNCQLMLRNSNNAFKAKCRAKIFSKNTKCIWDVSHGLEILMGFSIMNQKILPKKTSKHRQGAKFWECQMTLSLFQFVLSLKMWMKLLNQWS